MAWSRQKVPGGHFSPPQKVSEGPRGPRGLPVRGHGLNLAPSPLPGLDLGTHRRLYPRQISVIFDVWRPEMPKFSSLAPLVLAIHFLPLLGGAARMKTRARESVRLTLCSFSVHIRSFPWKGVSTF